jgi:hypothetical protein
MPRRRQVEAPGRVRHPARTRAFTTGTKGFCLVRAILPPVLVLVLVFRVMPCEGVSLWMVASH